MKGWARGANKAEAQPGYRSPDGGPARPHESLRQLCRRRWQRGPGGRREWRPRSVLRCVLRERPWQQTQQCGTPGPAAPPAGAGARRARVTALVATVARLCAQLGEWRRGRGQPGGAPLRRAGRCREVLRCPAQRDAARVCVSSPRPAAVSRARCTRWTCGQRSPAPARVTEHPRAQPPARRLQTTEVRPTASGASFSTGYCLHGFGDFLNKSF